MAADQRPIGVFDSGVGGLTVLRTLIDRFPHENFIYLGDTARLPYGNKSPETIHRYSLQNIDLLAKRGVKAVVIACNSASSSLSEHEINGLPIYNTIGPGAEAAVDAHEGRRIGLIGTRATVESRAYEKEIHRLDPEAQVFAQACPLLVPLAEEGWDADPVTNLIVYRYLQKIMHNQIGVLILGCTHYPLLAGSITRVTGAAVTLIDSGEAIAMKMKSDLAAGRWVAADSSSEGDFHLLVTDLTGPFREIARKILGPIAAEPELVDL